ncbi:MFS transporter [Paenibacillus sp. IITD108]|uniref:MFS transporter n=1 Tax=Paenibacillus sp. IITD108 TaxID=3116649 RepID=UPI002F42657A
MNGHEIKHADRLLKVLVFALIFSVMNGTMFNVALPMIGKEFELLPSQVSWVMTSYMVLYAIGSVIFGKLADRYSLKDLLTIGLIIFAFGSVVGMFAVDYWMVVAGRILQAAGASVMPATAMIIPVRYFAPEKRGRALGTTAMGLALGSALGPIVAGMISNFGSWRILFLFSMISLATLPFFRKYLNDSGGQKSSFDLIGGILLGGAIAMLLLTITQGSLLLLAGALILFVLFFIRIKSSKNPFIEPALFANRSYSIGLAIAFFATSMNFGLSFMTPQFLSAVNGLTPGSIGFVLFPAALCASMLGRRGGRIADERGNGFLVMLAGSSMLLCFLLLSSFVGASPYVIAIILISGNIGLTFMQIAMSNTISRTLSKTQIGVGMGLFSMMNFISGAISMSVIGKFLDQNSTVTPLNPIVSNSAASIYSNILLVMSLVVALLLLVYNLQFGMKRIAKQPTAAVSGVKEKGQS